MFSTLLIDFCFVLFIFYFIYLSVLCIYRAGCFMDPPPPTANMTWVWNNDTHTSASATYRYVLLPLAPFTLTWPINHSSSLFKRLSLVNAMVSSTSSALQVHVIGCRW